MATPPQPLAEGIMFAALDLLDARGETDVHGRVIGGGFNHQTKASPLQLATLFDALEELTNSDPFNAAKAPEMPVEVRLALQAEFHTRVGGGEDAETSELLTLAKQVVSEAEEARAALRDRAVADIDGLAREGGEFGSAFGGVCGASLDAPPPPTRLSRMISRKSSHRLSQFAGLPAPLLPGTSSTGGFGGAGGGKGARCSCVGGFGFIQEGGPGFSTEASGGDNVRERRSVVGFKPGMMRQASRAGRRSCAQPRLIERDISAQHLAVRREKFNDNVRDAVGVLARDKALRTETARAEDAPALVSRLSQPKVGCSGGPSLMKRVSSMGSRVVGGSRAGRESSKVRPSSPRALTRLGGTGSHYQSVDCNAACLPSAAVAPPVLQQQMSMAQPTPMQPTPMQPMPQPAPMQPMPQLMQTPAVPTPMPPALTPQFSGSGARPLGGGSTPRELNALKPLSSPPMPLPPMLQQQYSMQHPAQMQRQLSMQPPPPAPMQRQFSAAGPYGQLPPLQHQFSNGSGGGGGSPALRQ